MVQGVVGSLRVNLSANIAEFTEGFARASKQLSKFSKDADRIGRNIQNVGKGLTIGITAPLALFGRKAVNTARDAEELQAAFDFSFGKMQASMNEFAVTTGDALGRSTQSLQEQAFTFNQLFKTALDPQAASELSQQFTLLTNDLSSFFNVAEDDALTKLRSGLVGEAEPLRAFGVFLSAAAVQAKALELGIGDANGQLTEQEKILARAAIIMEQTSDAQGDLIRTSESFANKQRELGAEIDELSVIIGQELIPPLTELLKIVVGGIKSFRELDPSVQKNAIRMAGFAAALGPGLIALGSLVRLVGFASKGLAIFATVSATASGAAGKLKLNVLGLAVGFAAMVGPANSAGKALGGFLDEQFQLGERLAIFKATLPKAIGGLGVSADEARQALERTREARKEADRIAALPLREGPSLTTGSTGVGNVTELTQAEQDAATATDELNASLAAFTNEVSDIDTAIAPATDGIIEYKNEVAALDDTVGVSFNNFNPVVSQIEIFNDALRNSGNQLARAIVNFDGFGGSLKNILASFLELVAIQPFINQLSNLFTGGASGGSVGGIFGGIGKLFGGARADGGPVMAGRSFLVGERGPELFVPRQSGEIIANDDMGGRRGRGGVTVNQRIVAEDPNAFRASERQQGRRIKRALEGV